VGIVWDVMEMVGGEVKSPIQFVLVGMQFLTIERRVRLFPR